MLTGLSRLIPLWSLPTLAEADDSGGGTTDQQQPKTDDATGTNGGQQGDADKRFTQADLDAIVKRRLDEEKERQRKAKEKADADAEAKRLTDQSEFKTLADKHDARVKELEPQVEALTGERDRALKVITDQNAELAKDLPEWVTDAIAGKDAVDTFAFLSKHRAAIVGGGDTKRNGPPETKNGKVVDITQEQLNQALRDSEARMRASF